MSFDPDTPLDQMSFDDPDEELFFAIGWLDRPGVSGDFVGKLRRAHARGADLDAESEDGETPLTTAIIDGTGSPTAVRVLLELGADPSKRATSGWTPWSACMSMLGNPVVEEQMQEIRALLVEHGADTGDERLLAFNAAVRAADEQQVRAMLEEGIDLSARILAPIEAAIDNDDLSMVRLLVEHGASPEGNDDDPDVESPLICAAVAGRLEMVKLLVESGAAVDRYAYEDPKCTAAFMALDAGHEDIADWLQGQTSDPAKPPARAAGQADPKFAPLYENRTSAVNFALTTDGIVEVLRSWDERFGIEISEVSDDRLLVVFDQLPEPLADLAREIYEFCPDVVEQGFGCMDEMVSMAEETGRELRPDLQALVDGIDFTDEGFGLEILQRDLKTTQRVALWWD
jgi:ankyrin repeat protein